MGVWSAGAAAVFMLGYLLIGVGFLLFYLDAMLAVIRVYGNLGRALGLQWLFGGTIDKAHPGTVVASTMVIIVNSLGILGGAVVLVMSLVNAYAPDFVLDALFDQEPHLLLRARVHQQQHLHGRDRGVRAAPALHRPALDAYRVRSCGHGRPTRSWC